jgi:FKBP-type peptidyl-prolyl cis-trans isomerase
MKAIFLSLALAFSLPAGADDLAKEKQASADYLARMAQEPMAKAIDQGIVIRPIFESGSGNYAQVTDTVKVAYHLVDRDGKVLDESITADQAVEFPLNKLIKCWQIAVPKIAFGSFYKVSCPSAVAYGDKGAGGGLIKPGAALTFRIQVFGVVK